VFTAGIFRIERRRSRKRAPEVSRAGADIGKKLGGRSASSQAPHLCMRVPYMFAVGPRHPESAKPRAARPGAELGHDDLCVR